MKILTILALLACFSAHSFSLLNPSVDFAQSTSKQKWNELDNQAVKLIYPRELKPEAEFIANLLEHYQDQVGLSFGIKTPRKFPLVLRSEFALPNGFVTLGPRRSEWYASSIFSPVIGGLNFYQSLAIHEYRHIVQFDYMNRSTNKVAYALFGDFGIMLAIALGIPPWFLEGDAVWAETQFSDAGRGRSPRFQARLKALVLSDQAPTYDEFLAGTYNTNHPDHYVFGYYLVTRAYRIYGPGFWERVLQSVSGFSFNPYALTNAFRNLTGLDFEDYFAQTMSELKQHWKNPNFIATKEPYRDSFYPLIDQNKLYYLKRPLDGYWGLYRYGKKAPEVELAINPALSRVDLRDNKLLYTQFLPHQRFSYKNYSDLFVYDLASKKKTHLLQDQRVYHPQFSPSGQKISVIKHEQNNEWVLSIIDLSGQELRKIKFNGLIISEATWQSELLLYAIVQNIDGKKNIMSIDLNDKKTTTLLEKTRNNIFALSAKDDQLFFEADDQDSVQIFALNLKDKTLARCTQEAIAAYNPRVHQNKLFFIGEFAHGKDLKSSNLSCEKVASNYLNDYNYLPKRSIAPAPVRFEDFKETVSKSLNDREHSEYFNRLTPHSWTFFSGRGIHLSQTTTNYLNSLSYTLGVGRDSEEQQPFGEFSLSYSKWYPVFTLSAEYRKREEDGIIRWNETEYGVAMTLPYRFQKGLYSNQALLTFKYSGLDYSQRENALPYELSDDKLQIAAVEFNFSSKKNLKLKNIWPDYGIDFRSVFKNAKATRNKQFSSDVFYQNINLYLPSIFNHGFKFSFSGEKQSQGFYNYRHEPINNSIAEYIFSRGYKYRYVDQYLKFSSDYALPLFYPDFDLSGWAFLRRIYAKVFFDHTNIEIFGFKDDLNSTGAELLFETYLLRKFDLTLGARASHRFDDGDVYDFFIGTQVGF